MMIKKKNKNESNFVEINKDLETLKTLINDLGDVPVKDEEKRKNVESYIKGLNAKFDGLDGLLSFYEKYDEDKYKKVKTMFDKSKEQFDILCKEYNGKCPLKVKAVREAKRVYKKHKKLSLISAGLASMTLLTSGYTLVPALMHGNAMLGNAVPAFNGMMNFFNKVLGSLIGASLKKNGTWVLATGVVLNGTVATTSILKFLATIGVGTATLAAPLYIPQIVSLVKQLVDKIKEYELKQKLANTYKSGVKKVKETVQNVEKKINEYDLRNYYDDLLVDYLSFSNVMSFDEFCKKRKLSNGDREILELKVKLENKITNKTRKKGSTKFAW